MTRVYKTRIDDEQVKVTVSRNVDPSVLIKRPEKSKMHAELRSPQKPYNNNKNKSQKNSNDNPNFNFDLPKNDIGPDRYVVLIFNLWT